MARPCEADNFVGLVPCRPDGRFRVFGGQFDETVFCYNTSQPKTAVQRRKHLAEVRRRGVCEEFQMKFEFTIISIPFAHCVRNGMNV